jgi:riboflavin synthase
MFTGIVEKTGPVRAWERATGGATLTVATGYPDLALGESVAVNGVCLTVTEATREGDARFFLSEETLRLTNLSRYGGAPSEVNLERALRLGDRLSGHIVQGHVDGLARMTSARLEGDAWRMELELPRELLHYCVPKGSIALNGVSLTVNQREDDGIALHLIPHTWKITNLCRLQPGDTVNCEVDVLAKHVERLCQPYPPR